MTQLKLLYTNKQFDTLIWEDYLLSRVFDLGPTSHANIEDIAWRKDKHLMLLEAHLMYLSI